MRVLFHFRKTIALAVLAVTSVAVGQEVQQRAPASDLEIIDEVDHYHSQTGYNRRNYRKTSGRHG